MPYSDADALPIIQQPLKLAPVPPITAVVADAPPIIQQPLPPAAELVSSGEIEHCPKQGYFLLDDLPSFLKVKFGSGFHSMMGETSNDIVTIGDSTPSIAESKDQQRSAGCVRRKIKMEPEEFSIKKEPEDTDVITIFDSPEVLMSKSKRTPPRGSGFTPVRKKLSYSSSSGNEASEEVVNHEALIDELRRHSRLIENNTNVLEGLLSCMLKMQETLILNNQKEASSS